MVQVFVVRQCGTMIRLLICCVCQLLIKFMMMMMMMMMLSGRAVSTTTSFNPDGWKDTEWRVVLNYCKHSALCNSNVRHCVCVCVCD